MKVFFSTMLYALGKELGLEGAGAEWARQLAEPYTDSLPAARVVCRLATIVDGNTLGVYNDNSATCIAKARSRAFHAAFESGCDVWLSCDDDVEAPRATLAFLLDAANVPTPRAVFVPTTLRGQPNLAGVKYAKGPSRPVATVAGVVLQPDALYPIEWAACGMFAVNRAALNLLERTCQHLAFRDHDGVQRLALFLETIEGGHWMGEDNAFCQRASLAGVELLALGEGLSKHGDAPSLVLSTTRPTTNGVTL
jgi:hypothetical protein